METHKRSIVKSLSWRFFATITTSVIVWMLTHEFKFALTIGVADSLTKLGIYYVHERIWDKINFGRKPCKPELPDYQI